MAHTAVGTTFHAIPPGDLNAENDRADGRASFLRAPDTVAPPVALEPDNSPYRAPGFPGNEREIGAQNLRNLDLRGGLFGDLSPSPWAIRRASARRSSCAVSMRSGCARPARWSNRRSRCALWVSSWGRHCVLAASASSWTKGLRPWGLSRTEYV